MTLQQISKQKSNLTPNERSTLKNLKAKDITILRSDKGTEFCAIETEKYNQAGIEHLEDRNTYEKVNKIQPSTLERRINSQWTQIARKINLTQPTIRNLSARNSTIPKFYHLIKTHKNSTNIKIRPIVSNVNGPTRKLAWLMTNILTPTLKNIPAHLERSSDLLQTLIDLPQQRKETYTYPFSLDVVSLYTSIPPQEAIQATIEHLQNHPIETYGLTFQNISDLLKVITDNTYLQFQNTIYRQIAGLPMGSSTSSVLAIIYMNKLESIALNLTQIGLYKRYVDDILLLTVNKEEAENIFAIMNSINQNITFEIEHPDENNTLSLLDFSINIDKNTGNQTFNFYKKTAKKDLFVNFKSALPTSSKLNYINNEIDRISTRCTKRKDREEQIKNFESVLIKNDYPTTFIHRSKNTKRNKQTTRGKQFYFEFPYINDKIEHKIKRIFQTENIQVSLYRKSITLEQTLKKKSPETCHLTNCPIKDNKLCSIKNCVYEAKCTNCNDTYIGSSIRPLHIRAREHNNNKQSSIYKHKETCKNEFTYKLLSKTNDITKLRYTEAIHIKKKQPKINSREESQELMHLIF